MKHYHLLEQLEDHQDALVEYCTRCKEKFIFYKQEETGRMKHPTYYQDVHARDLLQPRGTTLKDYIQEYGIEAYERSTGAHKKYYENGKAKIDNLEQQNVIKEGLDLRKKKREGELFFT